VSLFLRAASLCIAILIVTLLASKAVGQEKKAAVLDGTWKGGLIQETFVFPAFVISMEFKQTGEKVTGKLRSEVRGQPKYYAVMAFSGTLKGRTFTFEARKFLEQKPLPPGLFWVLPAGKLTLSVDIGVLEGPWAGARGAAKRLSKGTMIVRDPVKMAFKPEDLQRAAKRLGGELGCIVAVGEVESAGRGFLPSGLPMIRFDSHEFSRLTSQKYDSLFPTLSTKKRDPKLSREGEQEYDRLVAAMKLDRRAALEATAWGRFQILGQHFKACGYEKVEDFVRGMQDSELKQLEAFLALLKDKGLDKPLREKNWKEFARRWYGEDFAADKYDEKLAEAYNKFVKEKAK
jgi:hypothetical protein